jgi:hypothetical protein
VFASLVVASIDRKITDNYVPWSDCNFLLYMGHQSCIWSFAPRHGHEGTDQSSSTSGLEQPFGLRRVEHVKVVPYGILLPPTPGAWRREVELENGWTALVGLGYDGHHVN